MAWVAQVADRGCFNTLALGGDALKRRNRSRGQTKIEVHLAGIDRVPAHTLEHSTAVGVLLEAAGAALVVEKV